MTTKNIQRVVILRFFTKNVKNVVELSNVIIVSDKELKEANQCQ
jgi:hypothetical protein